MEALDELLGVGEVALEHPVHRPIAEAELAQVPHPGWAVALRQKARPALAPDYAHA